MTHRDDVDHMCARLRKLLAETTQLDRRGFMQAFGRAMAGSALATGFSGDSLTSAISDQCPGGALFGE